MKLVEKKCPNCGANLKFDKDDMEVTCKYCDTSFEIEKEMNFNELVEDVFDSEAFNLHKKTFKHLSRFVFIFTLIVFILIFIAVIINIFGIVPRVRGF